MFSLPLGSLGQLYAACTTCGFLYLAVTAMMGHIDVDSHHDVHHEHGGDDGGVGDDGGACNDGGAGDDGGINSSNSHTARGTNLIAVNRAPSATAARVAGGVGNILLGITSPMVVSTFFTGFGMLGLFFAFVMPALGYLTLVPALIGGVACTTAMRSIMRYLIKEGGVTTNARVSELPGQLGEVVVGISPSGIGEVTYIVHSKRLTSAAKSATGQEVKKGTKVLIVESQDHVLMVEPCDL